MNKQFKRVEDEDGDDSGAPRSKECLVNEYVSVSRMFDIYLDEGIESPVFYRKALKVFDEAGPNDLIKLKIDTAGGRLDTTIKFINAIQNTQAQVLGVLEGAAYSAGSMILLSCPNIEIQPFATMMIHNASFGAMGTALNMQDNVQFNLNEIERMVRHIYKDFLSEAEIESITKGNRELWFNDEQIGERLEKMFSLRMNQEEVIEHEETMEQIEEFIEKPKTPRKRSSKKTKVKVEVDND